MSNHPNICGQGTTHNEGRCTTCGGPFSPPRSVYILTTQDTDNGSIIDQELFSEQPTFPLHPSTLREGNIDGGDSIPATPALRDGPAEDQRQRERFETAVEAADLAFWDAIASLFPEVTSGDFSPDATIQWDHARDRAVRSWLMGNLPRGNIAAGSRVVVIDGGGTGEVVDVDNDRVMVRADPYMGGPWFEYDLLELCEEGSPYSRMWFALEGDR